METKDKTNITVGATIQAPVEKVWNFWTNPKHIVHWNFASDDWHSPHAENDLRAGGKFLSRMEAKDGSYGFDFGGVYDQVEPNKLIAYTLGDDRRVKITFTPKGNETEVEETFEAENTNSLEMQQTGWQAILDNFKKYVETPGQLETLNFEILINAKPEKVYDIMFDEGHYREWTAEFNPASRYEGSWEKGSKILFIGEDQDGNTGGMVSRIKENIPNQFVSIEHLGMIQNDKEITSGPEVEGWAGALENYTFTGINSKTLLSVEMDANHEYKDYFSEAWPKALDKLKEICETR
jgi:uncharacterized protein YndB with AHSA1/START domain